MPELCEAPDRAAPSRVVIWLVSCCFFMHNMDAAIVVIALPQIADGLNETVTATSLVVTTYVITTAVVLPLGGWLTQRFGERVVFGGALAVFTLFSFVCSASPNLSVLIVFRVIQGIGGALLVPVGRLIVLARTRKAGIPQAISTMVLLGLVAAVAAPLVAGVTTTFLGWRWIFLVNVPIGVAVLAGAWLTVRSTSVTSRVPFDWTGLVMVAVALGGLVAAAQAGAAAADPMLVGTIGTVAILSGVGAIRHMRRVASPLIDIGVLAEPEFRASIVGGSFFWFVVSGASFLMPLLLQSGFGWSPIATGLAIMLFQVANVVMKMPTTTLLLRFGLRPTLLVAAAGTAVSLAGWAVMPGAGSLVLAGLVLVLGGACRSLGITGYTTSAFVNLETSRLSHGNTVQAATQQGMNAFGVAAVAAVVNLAATVTDPVAAIRIGFAVLAVAAAAVLSMELFGRPSESVGRHRDLRRLEKKGL